MESEQPDGRCVVPSWGFRRRGAVQLLYRPQTTWANLRAAKPCKKAGSRPG